MNSIGNKLLREATCVEIAAYLNDARAFHNHPLIVAYLGNNGQRKVKVVTRLVQREFPIEEIGKALSLYKTMLEEMMYGDTDRPSHTL